MILKNTCLRIQLTGDATPTLPGVSGPVPLGMRYVEHYKASNADEFTLWGLDLANITNGNTPVISFANGVVSPDDAEMTGNPGVDFEGMPLDLGVLRVLVFEVTGNIVTATKAGPVVLARLPIGHSVIQGDNLAEWVDNITFAAISGTAATLKFTALFSLS